MTRAYNPPSGHYYPTQPCPTCGVPVFHVNHSGEWFDATGTPSGGFTRMGFPRHPNDIARSRHQNRADGHARHRCTPETS